MIERMLVLALLAMPAPSWAQGADTATSPPSASEESAESDAVQIGAGSTSAVTTGSSGGEDSEDDTVTPIAPSFSITPQQESFLGPGMLAIQPPDRLRCDVIAAQAARAQCERRSANHATESAND